MAVSNPQNAQIAYQYFLGKGLSPAQAAGIVGNLEAESNINPEDTNSIGCIGIAQWCGGRRNPTLQTGDPSKDLYTQLDYIWYEMNGPEAGTLTALKTTTTAEDAARSFEATFERSGGALLAKREQFAADVLGLAQSLGWGPTVPTGQPTGVLASAGSGIIAVPTLPGGLQQGGAAIGGAVHDTASFLSKLWSVVSSFAFWQRVGEIVAGTLLIFIGAAFMLHTSIIPKGLPA